MGMFLNRGSEGFQRTLNSEIYVDKTDMISFCNKMINTEQSCLSVSRPRRFGKSITANMLAAYYETGIDSAPLFEGRKLSRLMQSTKNGKIIEKSCLEENSISNSKKEWIPYDWKVHMNRYQVIRMDIADVVTEQGTPEKALDFIEATIKLELNQKFPGIFNWEKDGLVTALFRIYDAIKEQFVIIIDEWDYFFRDERSSEEVQRHYIDLLRGLFKGDRSRSFLALGYITGILPIKKYNSESALNNFNEYTMTSPERLAEYVGFSESEVKKLCEIYQADYEKLKEWYDGYSFFRGKHIYGPNSVVKAISSGEYKSYWSQTVAFNSLTRYITMNFDGLKDSITALLGGSRQAVEIGSYENDMSSFKNKDDILTALIHLGYLAYDENTQEVYIPNKEVRYSFERAIMQTGWDDLISCIRNSEELLAATLDGDEKEVAAAIEDCHMKNTSIIKYNDENSLSCVLTLAYYSAKKDYVITRELPAGRGFADLVFLPKQGVDSPALVMELKWNEDADTAIRQIKDNHYPEALYGYHGKVLLVGISYEKRKRFEGYKKHTCRIEKIKI